MPIMISVVNNGHQHDMYKMYSKLKQQKTGRIITSKVSGNLGVILTIF